MKSRILTRLLAAAATLLLPLTSAVVFGAERARGRGDPGTGERRRPAYTDSAGNTWSADRAYGDGVWG